MVIADVVVTYDIRTVVPEDDRRLVRVAAICERYGQRTQYSVFECRLSELGLARLQAELASAIDPSVDSVHFYRLGGSIDDHKHTLGVEKRGRRLGRPWIL